MRISKKAEYALRALVAMARPPARSWSIHELASGERIPIKFLEQILLSLRRVRLPRLVDRVLEQIPVAAFAAIVVPGVVQPGGHLDLHASNLYLYAALATVLATLLTRNLPATIVVGVGLAILLQRLT